jgi:hypothetical protein
MHPKFEWLMFMFTILYCTYIIIDVSFVIDNFSFSL